MRNIIEKNILSFTKGNTNQNHNKIPLRTHMAGHNFKKKRKRRANVGKDEENQNPYILLV